MNNTYASMKEEQDEVYQNPKFAHEADRFLGLIRDRIVREKREEPTKEKLLAVATEIIKGRLND